MSHGAKASVILISVNFSVSRGCGKSTESCYISKIIGCNINARYNSTIFDLMMTLDEMLGDQSFYNSFAGEHAFVC